MDGANRNIKTITLNEQLKRYIEQYSLRDLEYKKYKLYHDPFRDKNKTKMEEKENQILNEDYLKALGFLDDIQMNRFFMGLLSTGHINVDSKYNVVFKPSILKNAQYYHDIYKEKPEYYVKLLLYLSGYIFTSRVKYLDSVCFSEVSSSLDRCSDKMEHCEFIKDESDLSGLYLEDVKKIHTFLCEKYDVENLKVVAISREMDHVNPNNMFSRYIDQHSSLKPNFKYVEYFERLSSVYYYYERVGYDFVIFRVSAQKVEPETVTDENGTSVTIPVTYTDLTPELKKCRVYPEVKEEEVEPDSFVVA
jgi:hypothetical protein